MAIIVNFTKMQFLNPNAFGEEFSADGIINGYDGCKGALAALLADGNGRGGGDLDSDALLIGSWAGDRVGLISDTDIVPEFSLPGLENEPLLPQVMQVGEDISASIRDIIVSAERTCYKPGEFILDCVVPLHIQRKFFSERLAAQIRTNKVEDMDVLWAICGAEFKFSKTKAQDSLETGIKALWKEVNNEDIEVCITDFDYSMSSTSFKRHENAAAQKTKSAAKVKFTLTLRDGDIISKRKISLKRGFDVEDAFSQIFGIAFYKPKPDVSKLEDSKAKAFVQGLIKGAA